jgi:hypothetical protein
MEKAYIAFAMLALLLFSFGCTGLANNAESFVGGGGTTGSVIGVAPGETTTVYKATDSRGASAAPEAATVDTMVIKTGSATIELPENTLAERYAKLKAMAAGYGGDVESSSYYESASGKTQYVTVRINSTYFDAFTGRLSEIGTVKTFSSNTEDVTQQYIDTNAKLVNLIASRDRLLALYNMSSNLSDIIMLEQEIENVQYQIDSVTQQKLYYERQSAKASVSITLSEPLPVVNTTLFDPFSQLANFFVESLAAGVTLVVIAAGFLLPLAFALFVLWKIAAWIWSKTKKK